MKKILLVIFLASPAFFILFSSCHRTIDVKCDTTSLEINTEGLRVPPNDSAKVIKYKQDNLFDSAIDSASFKITATTLYDTFFQVVPSRTETQTTNFPPGYVIPGYDYKLQFLLYGSTYATFTTLTNKIYLITNIVSNGLADQEYSIPSPDLGSKARSTCLNQILSCNVNGTNYAATPLYLPQ